MLPFYWGRFIYNEQINESPSLQSFDSFKNKLFDNVKSFFCWNAREMPVGRRKMNIKEASSDVSFILFLHFYMIYTLFILYFILVFLYLHLWFLIHQKIKLFTFSSSLFRTITIIVMAEVITAAKFVFCISWNILTKVYKLNLF